MCMLFVKPKDVTLPKSHFKSLWDINPDGLAVYNLDTKNLFKTLDEGEAETYLNDNVGSTLIVHFRMATSGAKTLRQLHGFAVCGSYLLFHNGVLKTFAGTPTESDTQQLAHVFNDAEAKFTIDDLVKYLETHESSSRFLIVNVNTGEIIKPECAEWNEPTKLPDGTCITYSNTYAMAWHLLGQDNYYDSWNLWKKYDDSDAEYADAQLLNELQMIQQCYDRKSMLEFVYMNPEFVADYLIETI